MWKKRKDIDGVGANSMVGLKAMLAQREQVRKRYKGTGQKAPKSAAPVRDMMAKKNRGVTHRSIRDRCDEGEEDPLEVSARRMEEKARMYERLMGGEEGDGGERYLVDFEQKGWQSTVPRVETNPSRTEFRSSDMIQEEERRRWEAESLREIEDGDELDKDKLARLNLLDQMIEETHEGRERHEYLKAERERRKRERMRKIEDMKAKRSGKRATSSQGQLAALDDLLAEAKRSAEV